MSYKWALFLGSILAALSVALGALGAHALKTRLSAGLLEIYETAVRYQFFHSLALLAAGILMWVLATHTGTANSVAIAKSLLMWATYGFLAGLVLFSGSLYVIIYLQQQQLSVPWWIGIATPIGGLCFIAGWILLAFASLRL
ncbi:MAG: DUF423 domain-containing protein [Thermoflavifilum sp.]|nr:DUF423 domain-containing protein [Thermoflavifilum sp.]